MEIVTNFLTNSPWIQLFCARIPLFIGVILYLAFAGVGAMLIAGRALAKQRKRTSYDKCAQQLGYVALLFGIPMIVGFKAYLYLETGSLYPVSVEGYFIETAWFMTALTVFYIFLYVSVWKSISKKTWLQNIFGSICFLQGISSILVVLIISKVIANPNFDLTYQKPQEFFQSIIPTPLSPAFNAAICLIPIFFILPAIFGNIGLLFLRYINDYGRDHYNIAIGWCTNWIKIFGILLCLIILTTSGINIWQQYEAKILNYWDWLDEGIFLFLWIIISVIMSSITKSQLPLRHKFSMIFADLLALVSIYFCIDWWLAK